MSEFKRINVQTFQIEKLREKINKSCTQRLKPSHLHDLNHRSVVDYTRLWNYKKRLMSMTFSLRFQTPLH